MKQILKNTLLTILITAFWILLFIFAASFLTGCGTADKIETSHYRLWSQTKALKIIDVTKNKVIFIDFPEMYRYSLPIWKYQINTGSVPYVGDTLILKDHLDLLPDFGYLNDK